MDPKAPNERIALFRNMVEADPENELAHFSLGKLLYENGDYEEAVRELRRTLELNPQHTQAHRYLGEALLALDRDEEAVAVLEEGYRLAHRRGEILARNTIANLLERQGRPPPQVEERPAADSEEGGAGGEWLCSRCFQPNPRLEEPPFRSELGRLVHEKICKRCWQEWVAVSIKVINEYRLNLASPEGSAIYDQHMKEFLGL